MGGCYEVELVRVVCRMLKPGAVFLDIGAHIGFFTAVAAPLVGREGRVHSFEPDPALFERLRANMAGLPCVTVHNMALSDETGATRFYRGVRGESGWGSLIAIDGRDVCDVQTTTLDRWRTSRPDVDRIDLVKIDVEGFEAKILRQGLDTLAAFRPALLLELNEPLLRFDGMSARGLVDLLTEIGYRCHTVRPIVGSVGADTVLAVRE